MGCVGRQEVDMSILGGLERRERTEFVDLTFGRPPLSLPYKISKSGGEGRKSKGSLKIPHPPDFGNRWDFFLFFFDDCGRYERSIIPTPPNC